MASQSPLAEFRDRWLPHTTDSGLSRLIQLLEAGSPLLIHGTFARACAQGCIATHIGWHHPDTRHLHDEAGVFWLTKVAGLNPATSAVIQEWDRGGVSDWGLRGELLRVCHAEVARREEVEGWCEELTHAEWQEC